MALIAMVLHFPRSLWRGLHDREFRALLVFAAMLLIIGTLLFSWLEGWSYTDAFYFSATTLTTVGYGDVVPVTDIGKMATVIYLFLGMGVIFAFINAIAHHTRQDNPVQQLFEINLDPADGDKLSRRQRR